MPIRPIEAAQTYPLRIAVLRPGRPLEAAVFPSDDVPGAWHLGAFVGAEVVGIASIFPEAWPLETDLDAGSKQWRLRGMAVDAGFQRRGLGAELVRGCLAHVAAQGGTMLWCNARLVALEFYLSLGFESVGEEFDIPGVGPHFLMRCQVASE